MTFILLVIVAVGVVVVSRIMRRQAQRLVAEREQLMGRIGELEEELAQQERRDPLTGLDNRRAFDEAIHLSMARMRRYGEKFYVVALDVDHFKKVNDAYGHAVGDEVLCAVSSTLRSTIREVDRAFRIGGEEFVVLLTDVDARGALVATDRIRRRIANRVVSTDGHDLQVTASFGLAQALTTSTPAELLRAADTALYAAKANGRNRIEAAPPFPLPTMNATA